MIKIFEGQKLKRSLLQGYKVANSEIPFLCLYNVSVNDLKLTF